jgi:hypothetical protein
MELTYRGLHYDYDPPTIDMMEGEAGGLYRGCQWQTRYPRHVPVTQPSHSLKYRGVTYSSHGTTENQTLNSVPATRPEEVTTVKKTDVVSNCKPKKAIWQEACQIHQANMCRNLERRMNVAKAKGDRTLMNLLEQESQDLACTLF